VPVAIERLLLGAAWADAGATATDGVSISTLLNFRTPLKPYRSQWKPYLKPLLTCVAGGRRSRRVCVRCGAGGQRCDHRPHRAVRGACSTLFELDGSLYLKLLFTFRNNAHFAASIRHVALIGPY
jgi:hypothetical protein